VIKVYVFDENEQIRGGINISAMEITSRIMEHPAVREATIVVPDTIYGEEIVGFVQTK
jgi:non-ribosomal peptide synthetase component E (peptide arylation enzyme)